MYSSYYIPIQQNNDHEIIKMNNSINVIRSEENMRFFSYIYYITYRYDSCKMQYEFINIFYILFSNL